MSDSTGEAPKNSSLKAERHPSKSSSQSLLGSLGKEASREANRRAAAILEVLGGFRTPSEAASALGISVSRYYLLERKALAGLLASCEQQPKGPREPSIEKKLAALERELETCRRECLRQAALETVPDPWSDRCPLPWPATGFVQHRITQRRGSIPERGVRSRGGSSELAGPVSIHATGHSSGLALPLSPCLATPLSPIGLSAHMASRRCGLGHGFQRGQLPNRWNLSLWTSQDLEHARQLANTISRPWGKMGPTPDAAWRQRPGISKEWHQAFHQALSTARIQAAEDLGIDLAEPLSISDRARLDRMAIARTLEQTGYLTKIRVHRPPKKPKRLSRNELMRRARKHRSEHNPSMANHARDTSLPSQALSSAPRPLVPLPDSSNTLSFCNEKAIGLKRKSASIGA